LFLTKGADSYVGGSHERHFTDSMVSPYRAFIVILQHGLQSKGICRSYLSLNKTILMKDYLQKIFYYCYFVHSYGKCTKIGDASVRIMDIVKQYAT